MRYRNDPISIMQQWLTPEAVWVNGQLPRRSGYPSPATIQGFNMPNRVVLTTAAKAGDKFEIAIFWINGPISSRRRTSFGSARRVSSSTSNGGTHRDDSAMSPVTSRSCEGFGSPTKKSSR